MSNRFSTLTFTPTVKSVQAKLGSRASYARLEGTDSPAADRLSPAEVEFVATRDSFYMATVSETGWPYVQHRGGPKGFLKVIDDRMLGFADYRGNRQYISVGNLMKDDRVSLFLIDYPTRQRLKILGHARLVDAKNEPQLIERLRDGGNARTERGIIIALEGFDWNCPQHITPRFTESEVAAAVKPLEARLQALEAENAALRAGTLPCLPST